MKTGEELTSFLKKSIKAERKLAYKAVIYIILGMFIGVLFGALISHYFYPDVNFIDIITKVSGLGITTSTVIGTLYYLYKYDELEERKISFLRTLALNDTLNQSSLDNESLGEIIFNMLKERLNDIKVKE